MRKTVKYIKKSMGVILLALAVLAGAGGYVPLPAAAASLDLSTYTLTGTYSLPRGSSNAREASAVTYNWDTGTLFVVGDEGEGLVEVDKTGQKIGNMILTGFGDTEGLTYVGNGQFVITEERERDAYLLSYAAGSTVSRSSLASADLGTTVDNIGIEGISYNPVDGTFLTVKEKTPQEINVNSIDFSTGSAEITSLFSPAGLGLQDLSDIQILSQVGLDNNLLILSQESCLLLEVTLAGEILSQYDFTGLSNSVEGVTIDPEGIIYLVSESGTRPKMYTLEASNPVPVPGSIVLLGSALLGITGISRMRSPA